MGAIDTTSVVDVNVTQAFEISSFRFVSIKDFKERTVNLRNE